MAFGLILGSIMAGTGLLSGLSSRSSAKKKAELQAKQLEQDIKGLTTQYQQTQNNLSVMYAINNVDPNVGSAKAIRDTNTKKFNETKQDMRIASSMTQDAYKTQGRYDMFQGFLGGVGDFFDYSSKHSSSKHSSSSSSNKVP